MRLLLALILLIGLSAQAQITISNATLSGVTSGSALLATANNFTASNTFSSGMMIWGDGNKTNGVWIGPSGEVLSNAVGSVTIAGGNVTASGTVAGIGSGLSNVLNSIQTFAGLKSPSFTTTARYIGPNGGDQDSTTEANISIPFARAGILTNFYVKTAAIGVATNFTCTVWTNGAASLLSVNYVGTGANQASSNLNTGVPIPAGCSISVEFKGNNAVASQARIIWSFEKLNQ